MKICWFGFMGRNHSWSIVAQNISRALINQGHELDLFSTNGSENFPQDLLPYLKGSKTTEELEKEDPEEIKKYTDSVLQDKYDMQLSYTALKNFDRYFIRGDQNRFGIWNYETTILPKNFARYHLHVDKVLPSSNFSKRIFADNGIPEDKMVVIPHGISLEKYSEGSKYPLKTKKKYKILANIAQPHVRKNITGLLNAFGKAFTKKDDVCLVLKIVKKGIRSKFEVDFQMVYSLFESKYKNHADVEIIDKFLPDIEPLYNACDIVFTMTKAECFWMPGLEAFAAKKMVIAPNYGGQLDFCNENNSLLIPGKEGFAGIEMQYWEPSPYAKAFTPDVDAAAALLKEGVNNYDKLMSKFKPNIESILPEYTWDKVASQMIKLCK